MIENIICLGKKYDIIEKIKRMGYNLILVHSQNHDLVDDYVYLSEKDAQYNKFDLEKLFHKFKNKKISGIIVPSEYYVELASELSAYLFLKVKGITSKQAKVVRDKLILKRFLQNCDIPTTKFVEIFDVTNFNDLNQFLGNSILIKPKREVLARGIEIIHNEVEWQRWRQAHGDMLSNYYAEEYLVDIKEYSCDTIVADGKILAQFPGEYTVTCLESNKKHEGFGVNFPGFLSQEKLDELKNLAKKFVSCLDIKDGFCHIEFFYTNQGWKFGEVAWRLPGGYQVPTESYVAGQDLLELYLKILIDTESTPTEVINTEGKYFGYYLYPKKVGKIQKIKTNFSYPWIIESKIHVKEGQILDHEDSSVTTAVHVVYQARSLDKLKEYSDIVKDLVEIEYVTS